MAELAPVLDAVGRKYVPKPFNPRGLLKDIEWACIAE
jgi:hypothetical protein